MAAIADSSGSRPASISPNPITTEVSRRPRVGSTIDRLLDDRVEVRAQAVRIDRRDHSRGAEVGRVDRNPW